MRLSIVVLVSTLAITGCVQQASHTSSARVHTYRDGIIQVTSPTARHEMAFDDGRVGLDYAVDVVSGATQVLTVDAVTSATKFAEQRHQLGLSGEYELRPETKVSGSVGASIEPDHQVLAPSIGVTQTLLSEMVQLSARYQVLVEAIGRSDLPNFTSDALGHRVDLGWTQILTEALVARALATSTFYSCGAELGCFSNPYRYLGVRMDSGQVLGVSERHPDTRLTGAAALQLSWALSDAQALHGGYRFAADDWGIRGHTLDLSFAQELFDDALLLRLEARGTYQRGASFYETLYTGQGSLVPAYRTADAELSRLYNGRLQLHAQWSMEQWSLIASAGRMWNVYPDFRSVPRRFAWLGGLGAEVSF